MSSIPRRSGHSHELAARSPPTHPTTRRLVILVDREDRPVGVADKAAAHQDPGHLHRAFSVFLIDDRDRLLLQRRAPTTHHFPRLWSNSCCSHPQPGETVARAARRRIGEELGLPATVALNHKGRFRYQARDPDSGLVEHEIDHVLTGTTGPADPNPDPAEVDDWCRLTATQLRIRLDRQPDSFTPWFRPALELASPGWWTAGSFRTRPGSVAFGPVTAREGASRD